MHRYVVLLNQSPTIWREYDDGGQFCYADVDKDEGRDLRVLDATVSNAFPSYEDADFFMQKHIAYRRKKGWLTRHDEALICIMKVLV